MLKGQITYDAFAKMGYIYLTPPSKFTITFTEELPENPDVILDLGNEVPIVGIELGGKSAEKLSKAKARGFLTKTKEDGEVYFSFLLENKPIRKSVSFKELKEVVFLFADEDYYDFIGIEVYGKNPQYQKYLSF